MYVLDTNACEMESAFLGVRKESASAGWYTMCKIYFRVGINYGNELVRAAIKQRG